MIEGPLIAVVYSVPLVVGSLVEALDGLGEVRAFPARAGDVDGLLDSLRPAAVVVDRAEEAEAAARYADGAGAGAPVLHLDLRERTVRLFSGGHWEADAAPDTSPQAVRNLLAAVLYGTKARR